MESFSFEFGRIFHEAVFVEWFACLWAGTDTTHDAPLLVTLVILNRHWVIKVQTICQGLQCNIRKTLMMAYCRDNGNYRNIHQYNFQVSIVWFHHKIRYQIVKKLWKLDKLKRHRYDTVEHYLINTGQRYKPANMHLPCQLELVPVAPKKDLLPLVYFPPNHSQGTFGTNPKERYYIGFCSSPK